jgi:ATP-dependent DNA ligase
VFRDGDEVLMQSRDRRPLDRYFPELGAPIRDSLPARSVVDGEIVIAGPDGLDFSSLLLRIHPAASRVAMLAREMPASLVVWDLLALGDEDLREVPLVERRKRLEEALGGARPPVLLTPATRDRALAVEWFERFEGAGLDGVVAKRLDEPYRPGVRSMIKVKHARTADCVVAGFRWHKDGPGTMIGSLLLRALRRRRRPAPRESPPASRSRRGRRWSTSWRPCARTRAGRHPWRVAVRRGASRPARRAPPAAGTAAGTCRGSHLRVERVCEVAYDHLQGDRFRHATHLVRWRPDKQPADCRYDQLEERPAAELAALFAGR